MNSIASENFPKGEPMLSWTGERYLPGVEGQIALEHLHRYAMVRDLAIGKIVLDVACGEGYGSAHLAEVAHQVIGVDVSQDVIGHAIHRYKRDNLEFRLGSCTEIPISDSSIDLVVSFETIEHHDQHDAMMEEIKRVLRPEGVLVISSPEKYEYSVVPNHNNPFHVKELYRHEFENLMGTYFRHVVMYGQRVVYGSGILREDSSGPIGTYEGIDGSPLLASGMRRPIYLIAVGSDVELPIVSSSVFEDQISKSDACQSISAVVTERDGQIASLHQAVAERDGQIASLHQAVAERDGQIASLHQAVAERDGQIASLHQAVAERDGQIAELVHTVNAIRQSNSWRVTSPLRLFSHILKWRGGYFKSKARRSLQNFAKALYWKIPVQYREPVLFWLYRNVPSLFMGVGHFENWRRTNLGKSAAINGESHLLVIDDMPVTISLSGRIAIHLHMFYEDLASEFRGFLENMPFSYDLFVSVTTARGKALCHEKFESLPKLNHLHVEIVDNRGRDIAPFFCAFGSMLKDYNYIAHLHSKKSLYNKGVTDGWRQYLLEGLLGNEVRIRRIFGVMQTSTYGIVYPQNFYMLPYFANTWLANRSMGAKWCARLGISPIPNGYFDFPAGTMFWARTDALKPLFEAGITLGDFAEELGQTDGTFAHCLERLLVLTCLRQGFSPAILKDMKTPSSSPWRVEQCLTRSMDYTRDRLRAPHIKLIGFDIFDTLLCRPLLDAESVKEIVARRIGGEAGRLYLKYRPLAESNARNEYNRDIGLTPIYAKLAELTGLPHATLNLLRECEEYVERESLGPRSGGLELYREALTSGKPVVLISDTFLSLDHIEFSLRRHGVEGWRRLFVSSEIGLRKDTGALYDFIFSEFEISPSQFLMVGDNECSDVQIPVDKGAEFLSVMRPIEIGRSISNLRPIIKDIEFNGSLDEQLTLGLVIREEFSSTRYLDIEPGPVVVQTPFNTGYSIVGPLLVSFADWLLAMSRTEGTERLYFLAREGDLLKSVFDLWAQKASGSPSSHYLVVSRRAVSVPALKNLEDIYSVAQATYFSNTLESFLMERYGVDLASERWAIVAEKTRWNRSQIVEVKQGKIDHLRELLDLIQDDICQVAKSELEPLQLYFHKEGLYSSGRQAVVDVGYGATIQNYLNQIVSLPIHGYYLMTDRRSAAVRERHGVSVLGCMLDNVPCTAEAPLMYRYSFELEKLLSSSNAQVVKYLKDAEGEVQPVFRNLSDAEEKGNAFRVELQAGVLSYVKDAVHVRESLFPDFRPSTGVARQICEIFLQKHSCSEVPLLKGVALDDHYCGRGVVY